MSKSLHVIVLAAGQGTRMRSSLPKVLQPLGGRPLLTHVVEAAEALEPARIHVVYGHGASQVQSALGYLDVNWVLQEQQLGTGHAVDQAMADVPDDGEVLVLYGDVPLIKSYSLKDLLTAGSDEALALLTLVVDEPGSYGRILRDDDNRVVGIVEAKDATRDQLFINEINTGIMCAPAKHLRSWLAQLNNDNAQGEYYLTDVVGLAAGSGTRVVAGQAGSPDEVQGINNKADLAVAERVLQRQHAEALLEAGVTLRDPARFDQRGTVTAGADVSIDVNVVLEGEVILGDGVTIGPNCVLRNCRIGNRTNILPSSVVEHAVIGDNCQVGPFARLRPGTVMEERSKVGNFVETKKSRLGVNSKVGHLAYVGDATVGADVNIGAGVITCNYDGANKHETIVGDGAFVGSNSSLVAPVEIGSHATIGAGSVITKNAPPNTLTVSRNRQSSIDGWSRPRKKLSQ